MAAAVSATSRPSILRSRKAWRCRPAVASMPVPAPESSDPIDLRGWGRSPAAPIESDQMIQRWTGMTLLPAATPAFLACAISKVSRRETAAAMKCCKMRKKHYFARCRRCAAKLGIDI